MMDMLINVCFCFVIMTFIYLYRCLYDNPKYDKYEEPKYDKYDKYDNHVNFATGGIRLSSQEPLVRLSISDLKTIYNRSENTLSKTWKPYAVNFRPTYNYWLKSICNSTDETFHRTTLTINDILNTFFATRDASILISQKRHNKLFNKIINIK